MLKNLRLVVALLLINFLIIGQSVFAQNLLAAPGTAQAQTPAQEINGSDDVFASGLYGIYIELRPGEFTNQLEHLQKMFLPLMPLLEEESKAKLPPMPDQMTDALSVLSSAKVTIAALPTKSNLPSAVFVAEFPSEQQATDYDQQIPDFIKAFKAYAKALDDAGKQSGDRKAAPPKSSATSLAPDKIFTRRSGKVLVISDKAFELKNLRPDNSLRLADDRMFQSARGRFSNSAGFMYLDAATLRNSIEELSRPKPAAKPPARSNRTSARSSSRGKTAARSKQSPSPKTTPSDDAVGELKTLLPSEIPTLAEINSRISPYGATLPAAVAIGFSLNGDYYSYSAQFIPAASPENLSLLPVLSVPVAGPAGPFKAPGFLPEDTDILLSSSIDWLRTYDKIDALIKNYSKTTPGDSGKDGAGSLDAVVGFKFRDEMLAALGSELSIGITGLWSAVPLDDLSKDPTAVLSKMDPSLMNYYLVLSVKNREAIENLFPKMLSAFDIRKKDEQPNTTVIGDIPVTSYANLSYAIIDNCLVIAKDGKSLGRLIDARSSGKTLSANSKFVESLRWTGDSAFAEGYVSDSLMKVLMASAKKNIASNSKLASIIDGLNIEPMPITYAVLSDPIAPVYEAHSPIQMLYALFLQVAAPPVQARQPTQAARP
ncbi:MAG TPA: hypothetical protein VFC63_21465 [Blastocatellia bacterium]|nr:hypothetical protein [Blastocatellia bacterium]